jgi:hypothetical protein
MQLELTVPTSLNEIPLMNYQEFIKMREKTNDDEFMAQKMIEIFCGIKLKEIVNLKMTEVNKLILHFNELFSYTPKLIPTFKIGELEFGFITNLEDISFGEYVDLESNLKTWETYHKAMAVMYRPIKRKAKSKVKGEETYEIQQYTGADEFAELMKYAPLDVVLGSSVFFWSLGNELLIATMDYLEKEVKTNKNLSATLAKQLNLENNGDGINQYMQSLKETSLSLTKLPEWDYLNVLPT